MKIALDKKIQLGFIACSLTLVVVFVISFSNGEKYIDTNQWVNHTHQVISELDQVLINSLNVETGARGYVITGDENYLEPYKNSKSSLLDHIRIVKELTRDNLAQQENIAGLESLAIALIEHQESKIELRKKSFEEAELFAAGEGMRIQDEIRRIIAHGKEMEQTLLAQRSLDSEHDARRFNAIFIALLAIIVVVLIVVYVIIISNLKALRNAEEETANKNWSLAGSGELTRNMQGNKHMEELAQAIINHLTAYLHAHVGALYLADEDTTLRLVGAHALDKKENKSESIRFGEGLVGQAAAEKRTVLLTDIPSDYFTSSTGFGKLKPKNIIVVPFLFEGHVTGILELGSIHDFTVLQQQYLTLVVDSIAIAITSAQSRQKTKELLEETQRQAEELEAQQEELRQSNDELHAKTELLERSESELRTQQEELRQSNDELEEKANLLEDQKKELENAKTEIEKKANEVAVTSKYKSEFLANMSHELRTPLNSILILAQLLADNKNKTLGEKEVEFARNISNSGTDLLNLINEILDLSKVEAGKMELEVEEVSFQSITNNLTSLFSELARNRSIEFEVKYNETALPSTIATDQQRLEQVLKNLLSNALKFTNKGGQVTLIVDRPGKNISFQNKILSEAGQVVAFSVSDTGIGIPEDKQRIIFDAFQQADGSTKRKYGGTGLGLSISRQLALALGGEIQLESKQGKGSTFTIYLPIQFTPSQVTSLDKVAIKEPVKIQESAKKLEVAEYEPVFDKDATDDRNHIKENDRVILIIEDDKQFAQVLLDFVQKRNYKGVIAGQGNTGISYARHYIPDAILLDMNLPVMNGTEVLKQIKNDPALRHIPVQVISAHDQKKEGLQLGAFNYIRKPVTMADLQLALDRIQNFTSKKLKKLLIVEDNEKQNSAIRELMNDGDIQCFSAYRGDEAYEMLQQQSFDCMILDLGLPDMSGFDLMEKIRIHEQLNTIPIVVYTGKDLKKEETLRLGKLADTVVLKTANSKERLLDETTLFLHRVESLLPREKQNLIRKLHKTDEILRGKKVLLVDDDMRNIYSLTNALEEEELLCFPAENGKSALSFLKQDPSIDIVLMDVMMPEMDGYEATIEIRKLPEFKKLPIIALTAKAMKGDKEKCLAAGMSDYVSKPVHIEQLLSLMRVWLYR